MKIIWQDIVILIGFFLYIGTGLCTKLIIAEVGLYTEAAVALEANPIARTVMDFRYGQIIMQWLSISFFTVVYYLNRRRFIKTQTEISRYILSTFTIALFMLFMQNFFNDFSILVGLVS